MALIPLTAEFREFTPELAAQFLEDYPYDKQRPLRQFKVEQWGKAILEDRFLPTTSLLLIWYQGRGHLIDANHRLSGLVWADNHRPPNQHRPLRLTLVVVELEAETVEDLAAAYFHTDRGMARSVVDVYRTVDLTSELGLTGPQVRALGAAIAVLAADFANWSSGWKMMPDEQRLELIRAYSDPAGNYFELLDRVVLPSIRGAFMRGPIVALGLATFGEALNVYGPDKITEFWRGAMTDDGLAQSDPRKVAFNHLREYNIGGRNNSVSPGFQARVVAQCWNAWVSDRLLDGGEKRRTWAHISDTDPIKILGTHWDGRVKPMTADQFGLEMGTR